MPKRTALYRFFLTTALGAVALHWLLALTLPQKALEEKQYLTVVFPEAYGYTDKEGSPPRYTPFTLAPDGTSSPLGAVFRTTEVAPVPRGYAGPVPVLVGLDRNGTLTGVQILENRETLSYVRAVESRDFLHQFTGKSINDPLELDEDIDGVTRATVTAAAVTKGVRIAARSAASRIMGLTVPQERAWRPPRMELAALGLLLAAALASMGGTLRPLRWFSWLAGIAVLGYWQGLYLSTETAAKILLWRLPSPREHLLWYVLVVFVLTTAIFWRNVYCARLCPFGALQELFGLFSKGGLQGSSAEERPARLLRPLFLWLVTLAVFLFGRAEAAGYEPFGTAFDFKGGELRWALLAVVLFLALWRHRFWCRWFCPTGLWLQLLGRMRSRTPFDAPGD